MVIIPELKYSIPHNLLSIETIGLGNVLCEYMARCNANLFLEINSLLNDKIVLNRTLSQQATKIWQDTKRLMLISVPTLKNVKRAKLKQPHLTSTTVSENFGL